MVKIECSRCKTWVELPFYRKEDRISCPQCSQHSPVTEVFVSGGPFILHRDILVKNMHRYRIIISEAEKEMLELQKKAVSARAYEISARSIGLFISDLKEMLDGCRDVVRHNVNGVKARYTIEKKNYYGNIQNLSVSGICIEAGKTASVNRLWNEASVLLKGRKTGQFTVDGKVMWVSKNGRMGIRFSIADEKTACLIREYIIEKTANRPGGGKNEGAL